MLYFLVLLLLPKAFLEHTWGNFEEFCYMEARIVLWFWRAYSDLLLHRYWILEFQSFSSSSTCSQGLHLASWAKGANIMWSRRRRGEFHLEYLILTENFPFLLYAVLTFPVIEEKWVLSEIWGLHVVTASGQTFQPEPVLSSFCYVHLHARNLHEEPSESALIQDS